jgi:subtilisin family serine protease
MSVAIVTLAYAQKGPAWIRLILQTHSRASQAKTAALFKKYGAMVQRNTASGRMTVIQVPATAADHIREAFERSGLFTFVEKYQSGNGSAEPNDPRYASQRHLARIEAAAAWNLTVGSGNVPIAILDSGVDASHPELTARLLGGWSYLAGNSNTSDVFRARYRCSRCTWRRDKQYDRRRRRHLVEPAAPFCGSQRQQLRQLSRQLPAASMTPRIAEPASLASASAVPVLPVLCRPLSITLGAKAPSFSQRQ